MKKFDQKVTVWLSEFEPNFFQRVWNRILYQRHNSTLWRDFSVGKLLSWLSRLAMSVSGPATTHYVFKKATFCEAAIASGIIFALFSLNSLLEQWLRRKSSVVEAATAETWVQIGDLLTSIQSSSIAAAKRNETIVASLSIIEGYARTVTRSPKGEISVSLALYDGEGSSSMKIHHRNRGNERPIGRALKHLDKLLGHRACQSGPGPRVVDDLRKFGKEALVSPTQSTVKYRSLLLVPITSPRTNKVKGFISVDCARPYAFYGNRAKQLVVTCEPLIDHIQEQF